MDGASKRRMPRVKPSASGAPTPSRIKPPMVENSDWRLSRLGLPGLVSVVDWLTQEFVVRSQRSLLTTSWELVSDAPRIVSVTSQLSPRVALRLACTLPWTSNWPWNIALPPKATVGPGVGGLPKL